MFKKLVYQWVKYRAREEEISHGRHSVFKFRQIRYEDRAEFVGGVDENVLDL